MAKIYVSKIDNAKFDTKEELIKYLTDNFIIEDETGGEISFIHQKLKESFPFATIHVKKSDEIRYGEYLVNMFWSNYNSNFTFYIGKHNDYHYYWRSYDTVEDAISNYQKFIHKSDEIIDKLHSTYSPESITVDQVWEGDMNNEDGISFYITVGDKDYFGRYDFGNVDKFVSSFRGYFDKIIEGEVVRKFNHAGGYEEEPTVGGVPLKNIIERAKRLRIEILEESED